MSKSELLNEWESEIDRMSKRGRVCESKGLVIEWSKDPVIKGASNQVIKQLSD